MLVLPVPQCASGPTGPIGIFTYSRAHLTSTFAPPCIIPRSDDVDGTFYRTRREALSGRGYSTTTPVVPVAMDVTSGTGAKQYNVMPRHSVLSFVEALPASRRNLYVVVDPTVPCDPFFDLDAVAPVELTDETLFHAWRFSILEAALNVIFASLESYFGVKPAAVAVFDACWFEKEKVSFHIHVRMSDRKAFRNVKEHHRFAMTVLRPALQQHSTDERGLKASRSEAGVPPPAAGATAPPPSLALDLEHVVDMAVYTAWRLFRLPRCSKRLLGGRVGKELIALTPVDVPATHPAARTALETYRPTIEAASDVAGATFDDAAFAMALITRGERPEELVFAPEEAPVEAAASEGTALAPFKIGVRNAVTAPKVTQALLRLFQSLDSHYDPQHPDAHGGVTSLTRCEYEDNGQVRMYYVHQKQSRWCIKQQRAHHATHGQLYVTYGSVKYRCYSNDCFENCVVVPWTEATLPLRDVLFPSLPEAELFRRYPSLGEASALSAASATTISGGGDDDFGLDDDGGLDCEP